MKKNITGFVAIMLGMLLAFGTSAFKENKNHHNNNKEANVEYYFQFMGSHGNENNPGLWEEISVDEYDDLVCDGLNEGCTIITSSVTGAVPDRRPSSVPVDGSSKPTEVAPTIKAQYKN